MSDGIDLYDASKQFLLDYRTTPHSAMNQTPARLFLGRVFELKTRFSLLRPRETDEFMYAAQNRQIQNHRGTRIIKFGIGDPVVVKDCRGGRESWTEARIVRELVSGVTYLVEVTPEIIWKRHSNQIRECSENMAKSNNTHSKDEIHHCCRPIVAATAPQLRRSERLRHQK